MEDHFVLIFFVMLIMLGKLVFQKPMFRNSSITTLINITIITFIHVYIFLFKIELYLI
jgi:hypothetical protein